jgi:hypothetical protein
MVDTFINSNALAIDKIRQGTSIIAVTNRGPDAHSSIRSRDWDWSQNSAVTLLLSLNQENWKQFLYSASDFQKGILFEGSVASSTYILM